MAEKIIPNGFKVIKEGISSILIPECGNVFYNPVQEFNRDISVAVIKVFQSLYHQEKPKIFEVNYLLL